MSRTRMNCHPWSSRLCLGMFLLWLLVLRSPDFASAQASPREGASPCKISQLSAVNDKKASDTIPGGVGHHAITIAIQNSSASSCVLRGVPTATLSYPPSGRPFALNICANCQDYLFSSQPSEVILLRPYESAYVVLGFDINDGNGTCTAADSRFKPRFQYATATLGLYLADQKEPLRIVFDEWRSCGAIDITPFLKQPPMHGSLSRSGSPQ
jgi:hypothetical protein